MNKIELIVVVAGFMFVAGIGFSVHAVAPAGCPKSDLWKRIRVTNAIDEHKASLADEDTDGFACEKNGGFTYVDNKF